MHAPVTPRGLKPAARLVSSASHPYPPVADASDGGGAAPGRGPASPPGDPFALPDGPLPLVKVTLLTGGVLDGAVLDWNDHGLVIVSAGIPFVFAWDELDPGAAYRCRKALLVDARGGERSLTAEEHFELGRYMLARDRNVVAMNEFRQAERLDRSFVARVRNELESHRQRRAAADGLGTGAPVDAVTEGEARDQAGDLASALTAAKEASTGSSVGGGPGTAAGPPAESGGGAPPAESGGGAPPNPEAIRRRNAIATEKIAAFFNERLPAAVGPGIELATTDHFLIWSDLPAPIRASLPEWCEAMYAELCRQFGFDPKSNVFLGKCPIFCFRSKGRFQSFARKFDGYSGEQSAGYTRSVREKGYSHVVLFLPGRTDIDLDRFASTLVHEASHAFMHTLPGEHPIPNWVNEGYADLVAERVLGDRSITGENAALLARQYVRFDWSILPLLERTTQIDVHQYAVAQSVVAFIAERDDAALAALLRSLKSGADIDAALASSFHGWTLQDLEQAWRASVRTPHP